MTRRLILFFIFCVTAAGFLPAGHGEFEDLGTPVKKAGLRGALVGPDANGKSTKLYFNFSQHGRLLLVQVDPVTGKAEQFKGPEGPDLAWGFIVGPDKKIYLGTWKGGFILRFDPASPEKGIEMVGKASKTEPYIWMFTIGNEGKLYAGTYWSAKLVSYDTKSGRIEDLGRMDPTEGYSRFVAAGKDGWVYVGIGMAAGKIVAYNTRTREHQLAIPPSQVSPGVGKVWTGKDENVYGRVGRYTYRLANGKAMIIGEHEAVKPPDQILDDGRVLTGADPDGWYTLYDPRTKKTIKNNFSYLGTGADLFVLGEGPTGHIYGSTALPLELFGFNPKTGTLKDLGNPANSDGEVYSFAHLYGMLYMCSYAGPGAWLSIYDPEKPWHYGTSQHDNPYGYGTIGNGHLRPRAMIVGRDNRLYVGSMPPYGQLGGAMAVYDPEMNKVVENYRDLIKDQSIVALVQESVTGLIFGGSSVLGGGGAHATEKDAHLFAWDPKKKQKVIDIIPVPGAGAVVSMAQAKGKVFALLAGSTLVVFDTATKKIVYKEKILVALGKPLEISLGFWKGKIYGLTDKLVFTIDPDTYKIAEFANPGHVISCGWAISETGIYFGSDVHLMRWKW